MSWQKLDVRATADYQMVLPAARRLSTDPPLDEETQKALAASIQREGDASVPGRPQVALRPARRDGSQGRCNRI